MHLVQKDQLEFVGLNHAQRHVDEDGGDVGQREEFEIGEKDQRQQDDGEGADDARDAGCGAALDVEGCAGQGGGGGNAPEETGEYVGQGDRQHLLSLIEFRLRHPVRDPASQFRTFARQTSKKNSLT